MAGEGSSKAAVGLTDYLISIHELRNLVPFPQLRSDLSSDTLAAILDSHAQHLTSPSAPFGTPNSRSRSALNSGQVALPGNDKVKIELFEGEKDTALLISKHLNIDEVEALVLFRKFRKDERAMLEAETMEWKGSEEYLETSRIANLAKGKKLSNDLLDGITTYYLQEWLAVARLLTALLRQAREKDEDIEDLMPNKTQEDSQVLKSAIITLMGKVAGVSQDERKAFVYRLFSEFGVVMQSILPPIDSKVLQRKWTVHLLELQISILESLFLYNYFSSADITANLTRGLINGSLSCAFGAEQANRRQIEILPQGQGFSLVTQIRQLLGLICVDSLQFTYMQAGRIQLDEDTVKNQPIADRYLVQSPEHVAAIHDSLNEATCTDAEPFPLLLLAWAWILKQLPEWLLPNDRGSKAVQDGPLYQRVLEVVLRSQLDLFGKWDRILTGRLLWQDGPGSERAEDVIAYKDISRSLFAALADCVRIEYIPDYDGLVQVWCSLHGEGMRYVVSDICNQSWTTIEISGLASMLETTRFPYESSPLLQILRSMSGAGSFRDDTIIELSEEDDDSAIRVFDYLSNLPSVTFEYDEDARMLTLFERVREDSGHVYLVNRKAIELPGGSIIPTGSRGKIVSKPRVLPEVVQWRVPVNGWNLLLEILASAIGIDGNESKTSSSKADVFTGEPAATLSLKDIGITKPILQDERLLSAGLSLMASLVDALPQLAGNIAGLGSTPTTAGKVVPLLVAVIKKKRAGQVKAMDASEIKVIATATRLLASILYRSPGPVWDLLRRPTFFKDQAGQSSLARSLILLEIRRGSYAWTISFLRLVQALCNEVLRSQLSIAPEILQIEVSTLRVALDFTHAAVWSEYESWAYTRIGEKAIIGRLLCEIYSNLLRDPFVAASLHGPSPLQPIGHLFVDSFILSPAPFTLGPLLQVLRAPLKQIPALNARGRRTDSAEVEKHLCQALIFADLLLFYAQQINTPRSTALESLFTRNNLTGTQDETRSLVDTTFKYIVSDWIRDDNIALCSLQLLRTLARSLAHLGAASSPMLVCLEDATATAADLINILAHPERDLELTYAAWSLLNVSALNQPGLLRLCVTGEGEGSATIDASAPDRTAMAIALDVIERYGVDDDDESWRSNPRLLALVTSFLKAVWENLPDLVSADRFENNAKLWKAIEKLVLSHQTRGAAQFLGASSRGAKDHASAEDVTYCWRRAARANAVDLMHLALKAEYAAGASKNAAFTRTIALIANAEQLKTALAEAGQNACRPEIHQQAYELVKQHYPSCSVENLRSRRYQEDRLYGDRYLFDVQILGTIFDPTVAVNAVILADLVAVNEDWSLSDADAKLMQAWRRLLQAALEVAIPYPRVCAAASVAAAEFVSTLETPQSGAIIRTIQAERFSVFQVLAELSWLGEEKMDEDGLITVLKSLTHILDDSPWSPASLYREYSADRLHHTIYRTVLYVLGKLADSPSFIASTQAQSVLRPFLDVVLRNASETLGTVLELALGSRQNLLEEDMGVLCAIVAQLLEPVFPWGPGDWLSRLEDVGILRQSLLVLVQLRTDDASGRPLYARHILTLHASLVRHVGSAERLTGLGLLGSYLECPLFLLAGRQTLGPSLDDEIANSFYHLWVHALEVINMMLATLSSVSPIRSTDVRTLLEAMLPQADVSLQWNIGMELALFRITELHCIVDLFYRYACCDDWTEIVRQSAFAKYAPLVLPVFNNISYTLTHTGTLDRLVKDIEEYSQTGLEEQNTSAQRTPGSGPNVDAQSIAIRMSLTAIGQTVLLTLLRWSGSVQVPQGDGAHGISTMLQLPTSSDSKSQSPVHDILDFATTILDQTPPSISQATLTERRKRANIPQWRQLLPDLQLPDVPDCDWSDLVSETTEMCAVLASAQVVLSEDIAREAANAEEVEGKEDGSPDKATLELDWKGSQLDVKRKRASEGPSKQNLRDLNNFLQRMNLTLPDGKPSLYGNCRKLVKTRIPKFDEY